jgi:hypothetical protein
MAALIRAVGSFAGSAGGAQPDRDTPLIDGPAMARSMAAAPGIESVSLRNTSPSGVAGAIRISQVGDFLSPPNAAGTRFVTLGPGPEAGDMRLQIALDRADAPALLAMVSEDLRDYLSLLIAPAATGERLSRSEYLDLVASIYGKPLAEEIAAARIAASIAFPGKIGAVKGGTFVGATAKFDIPLLDLLVLESPLDYEVIWRSDER